MQAVCLLACMFACMHVCLLACKAHLAPLRWQQVGLIEHHDQVLRGDLAHHQALRRLRLDACTSERTRFAW